MPRENWQKIKLLKLVELLQQETDEQHPMTTNAICERMEQISLVFNEDNYYVVVYSARHDNLANYRVDRMEDVEVIAEDVSERAMDMRKCIGEYIRQEFKMYDGELQTVVLEFDSSLIGPIHDRFGENLGMLPAGEDRYVTTVQVRVAPTFWGWLFQFAGKMKIISPPEIVDEYRKRAEKAME